jgi:predicted lipoprotein with Yx(FWY)xxD motif
MKRVFGFPILLAGTVIALAACGSTSTAGSTAATSPSVVVATSAPGYGQPPAAPSATAAATQPTGAAVAARATGLGQILVDSRGLSLYLFEADRGTSSACYGACAQFWPPLLTHGTPFSSGNIADSLLGTTPRMDGTTQVTFAGHPLYFYAGDRKPGDVTGEGINAFGGGWDVLAPNGTKIEGGNS